MLNIIQSDCLNELKNIHDKTIDIIVTSPPYNLNINYGKYNDNLPYEKYLNWLESIFVELKRVLKDGGSFFLNIGASNKLPYIPMDVAQKARNHFALQNDIIWVKSITVNQTTFGHFKPINSNRFLNHQYEHIFHLTKDGDIPVNRLAIGVPYQDSSNINRWGNVKELRCRGNTWHIPYETVQKKKRHPAGFPLSLPLNCIKLAGYNNETIVLDPFLGAGTTLLACQELGIHGIGIEMDIEYCNLAKELLKL